MLNFCHTWYFSISWPRQPSFASSPVPCSPPFPSHFQQYIRPIFFHEVVFIYSEYLIFPVGKLVYIIHHELQGYIVVSDWPLSLRVLFSIYQMTTLFKRVLFSISHATNLFQIVHFSIYQRRTIFKITLLSIYQKTNIFKRVLLSIYHTNTIFKRVPFSVYLTTTLFKRVLFSIFLKTTLFKRVLLKIVLFSVFQNIITQKSTIFYFPKD